MNKIKSTLFLAIFVAITATTTLATDGQIPIGGTPVAVGGQIPIGGTPVAAGGQIPIGGRPSYEPNKTTAAIIVTATEPSNEIPFEISNYLWTLVSVFGQLKF